MFTVGSVYLAAAKTTASSGRDPLPDERIGFAAVLAGERPAHLTKPQAVDVWDAKGLAEGLVMRLARRRAVVEPLRGEARPAHLHPRGAAAIRVHNTTIGTMGPLHPDVVQALDLDGDCVVVEIEADRLAALGAVATQFRPIPRFPAATRDLAIVVAEAVLAGEVEAVVRDAAGQLAEDVRLFDRFVGGSIPKEHASLAFHVVYRSADRTLTDVEVDEQHAKVVAEVGRRFQAQLRA
jgi:phenylalanyl-tRNA synthetase beta chain